MNKELDDTIASGKKILISPEPAHTKMALWLFEQGSEVLVFEFKCDCGLHYNVEGVTAEPETKVFAPLDTQEATLEEMVKHMTTLKSEPFNMLTFNMKTERFEDIQKAINMNSKCFFLVDDKSFSIMKKDLPKMKGHNYTYRG